MIDDRFIAVNWGPRRESLDECAARAGAFFRELITCDPELTHWFQLGRSRKEALSRPVNLDGETLRELLAAGRNRADVGRKIIEDLGFDLWLWNGRDDDASMRVRIHCGSYSRWSGNSCVLDPPVQGPIAERISSVPILVQIMRCMVDAWDPDHGVVAFSRYFELRPKANEGTPSIGWLVYLSSRLGRVRLVPAPATVVPVGTKGSLIITTPERFSVDDPAHLAAADGVLAALEAAGLRRSMKR